MIPCAGTSADAGKQRPIFQSGRLQKNAPDVVFRETGDLFIVAFNRPSFLDLKDEGEPATQETTQEKSKTPKETPEKPQRNPKEVILAALRKQPSISIRELSVQCDMSVHSVQHHINKLKEIGFIRHVGPTKAGRWEVVEDRVDLSGGVEVGGGDE